MIDNSTAKRDIQRRVANQPIVRVSIKVEHHDHNEADSLAEDLAGAIHKVLQDE